MPGGNRMGPMARGPRTGRGAGFCTGHSRPGCMNRGSAQGLGGRRGGFGWRAGMLGPYGVPADYGYTYQPDAEMEREELLRQTRVLKNQLALIEKRLSEMEAGRNQTV